MGQVVFIPKEVEGGEPRVAASPETVKRLAGLGFEVVAETLPATVKVTHVSLFDGSNEGIACTDKPAFSVQYHPEASPGPQDSYYLFHRFADAMRARRAA